MGNIEGLLKVIIILLLFIVFGGWLVVAVIAALGFYGVIIGITAAVMAIAAAITYIYKKGIPKKISDFIANLRTVPQIIKLHPYLKWVAYCCDLIFVLSLFANMWSLPQFAFYIFVLCVILQIAFEEYKDISIATGIYLLYCIYPIIMIGAGYFYISQRLIFKILKLSAATIVFVTALIKIRKAKNVEKSSQVEEASYTDEASRQEKTLQGEEPLALSEKKTLKKVFVIIPFVVIIAVSLISLVSSQLSPEKQYVSAIDKMNVEKAVALYSKLDNPEMHVQELTGLIDVLTEEFINGEMDYKAVEEKFEVLQTIPKLSSHLEAAKLEVDGIHMSREAFSAAVKAEKKKDLFTAVENYQKVISKDTENYSAAKEKLKVLEPDLSKEILAEIGKCIDKNDFAGAMEVVEKSEDVLKGDKTFKNLAKDVKGKYKDILLDEIDALVAENKLTEAKKILETAGAHFPNDSTLLSLNRKVEDTLYSMQLKQAISEQLAYVEHTNIIVQDQEYKTLYPDLIEITIANASEKVIKNVTVEYRAYDKSGYLLDIKKGNELSEFETIQIKTPIAPGETYTDTGTEIDSSMKDIASIDACVVKINFEDGTSQSNAYYPLWKEKAGAKKPTSRTSRPSGGSNTEKPGSSNYNNKNEESGFEKYLKENDPDSYDFYQELEEKWDSLR